MNFKEVIIKFIKELTFDKVLVIVAYVLMSWLLLKDLLFNGILDFIFTYFVIGLSFILAMHIRGKIEKWEHYPSVWKLMLCWYPSVFIKSVRRWMWK